MMCSLPPILSALTLALLLPAAALAQGGDASHLTADEIESLFQNQLMKTRGLRIVTGEDETTTETAAEDYVQFDEPDLVYVRISFDFDSAALRPDQKPLLASVCQAMQSADVQLFRVVGHTDAVGSEDYNQRLSLLRAEEVRRHLVEDCGISGERVQAVGVGEDYPINTDDPSGDENRRVEFQAMG